jgi:hypothetical protein
VLLFLHPIDSDGDFFQHVNIGKFIIDNHTFPHFDNLTFTAAGREYVGYAWGAGVIFYLLYAKVGPLAVNLLVLGVALTTFSLLFWYLRLLLSRLSKEPSKDNVSFLTTLVIAPLIATRFPTRPEIFQFPLVAGILLTYELARQSVWKIYLLPIIILLWTNLYGSSAILGVGLIGLLSLSSLIKDQRSPSKFKTSSIHLLISSSLSLIAAFINPYGLKSLFFIQYIPKMTELWGDWGGIIKIMHSASFYGFPGYIIALCLTLLALVLFLTIVDHKEALKYPEFIILSLSLFVPFLAIRHRALAALLSAPILAILIANLSQKSKKILCIGAALMVLLVISISPPGVGGNETVFPEKMVTFIKTANLSGRVFNTQQIGSFLEYRLNPQIKTFSDTRDELFIGTNALESIIPVLSSGTSLNLVLRKYRIDIVILSVSDGNSYKDILHDPKWSLVYFDETYMVFVPTQVANHKKLSRIEVKS